MNCPVASKKMEGVYQNGPQKIPVINVGSSLIDQLDTYSFSTALFLTVQSGFTNDGKRPR
jgi:hypothetical protein